MPTYENPLRFLHITDTHIHPDRNYTKDYASHTPIAGVEAMIREINSLPYRPDFILHTGDVAYDPDSNIYDAVREVFSEIDVPIYYLAGNLDDSVLMQRELIGRDEAEIKPYYYYDFTVKGVQFVCLDSNGPHDPTRPSGTVTPEQLNWLSGICNSEDSHPLVIAIHHNVLPAYIPWLDDWMRLENAEALHEGLKSAQDRLYGVFYGHIHQNLQQVRDGIAYISGGSSWCQFTSHQDISNQHYIIN